MTSPGQPSNDLKDLRSTDGKRAVDRYSAIRRS